MHEITLVSPFPTGEGGWGDRGQKSKLKAGATGDKEGKPPRHLLNLPRGRGPSQTPPSRATDSSISPGPPSPWLPALPIEWLFYRFCGELAIPKAHPRRVRGSPPAPVPPGFSPGDARGEAPCIRKLKISPFPAGEGGRGNRGQESKLKAWSAGDKEGKPPLQAPQRQSQPAVKTATPPPGTTAARRGKPPRRKPTFSFPFPTREGKTFPQPVEKRVEKHTAWYAVWLIRKPFSHFFAVFRHDSTAAGVWKRPHGARKPHLLRQGQDSRAKISEVTDRISAARSAGIRPPPNA